ncbi:MAG: YihY/virulence factor BrkB family protein [Candidatus Rokubacteria bacterium]|nr:YihY/virulence factor BrkB family protein [Candidatus Rokubacteria bacterium]
MSPRPAVDAADAEVELPFRRHDPEGQRPPLHRGELVDPPLVVQHADQLIGHRHGGALAAHHDADGGGADDPHDGQALLGGRVDPGCEGIAGQVPLHPLVGLGGSTRRRQQEVADQLLKGAGLVGLAAAVGLAALVGVAAAFEADLWAAPQVLGSLLGILPSGLAAVGFSAVAAAVYRWVQTRQVPWTALFPPAVAAGLATTVVSQLFAILAPRLIGVGVLVGASVGVLAALLWLGIVFQVLLLGAAWTHWRVAGQEDAGAAETGEAGRGRG